MNTLRMGSEGYDYVSPLFFIQIKIFIYFSALAVPKF